MGAFIIIFITAIIVLFCGLVVKAHFLPRIGILGIITAILSILYSWNYSSNIFKGMLLFDHSALGFTLLILLAGGLILLLAEYGIDSPETMGDQIGLMLFSMCGGMIMLASTNLLMIFLGIEILSIPLYVLAGSKRMQIKSNEAALKYFLMGAFTTGILLMGIALIYGYTASFDLNIIQQIFIKNGFNSYGKIGFVLLCIGLFFKISAAPFHFWSPDVYEGSPSIVTVFMNTIVKISAIGLFYKLMSVTFSGQFVHWWALFAIISAFSMFVGNLGALGQKNFKRMLAYSSISHAGYMLLAFLDSANPDSSKLFYYISSYTISTIIAFAVFSIVSKQMGTENLIAFRGLAKKRPFLAILLTISLLSLAGIPPFPGFFGKYFLFISALNVSPQLIIFAILNSVISIAYYFKPIMEMYFEEDETLDNRIEKHNAIYQVLCFSLILFIAISIFPQLVLGIVK